MYISFSNLDIFKKTLLVFKLNYSENEKSNYHLIGLTKLIFFAI